MFLFHQIDDGRVPSIEYLPCSAIIPKAGAMMKITSGNLALASATDTPLYFCMKEGAVAEEVGNTIPVIRLHPDMVLQVATPSSFSQIIGAKVTIGADSLSITNTTGGALEIVYTDDEITRVRVVAPDPAG